MTDSGEDFAHKLFLAITGSVLPPKSDSPQETPQVNPFDLVLNGGENMINLTENELKAKALIVGRELARMSWWKMSAKQADKFCQLRAEAMGVVEDKEKQAIAMLAMTFVIRK